MSSSALAPLRFAVIGLGSYGHAYLASLSDLRATAGIDVTAVASRSEAQARETAERFGVARWHTTIEALVDDVDVDVVCVVTAEEAHAAPVISALKAGKQVIVEKPFAVELEDADAMIAAAEKQERHLMVGHQLRSAAPYVEVARRVFDGELGRVVSLAARRNRPSEPMAPYRRTHPLLETGIHDVDIMLWLAGERVTRVRAHARTVIPGQTPDAVWGTLEFESGIVGRLETVWLAPAAGGGAYTDDSLQVVGDRGTARLDLTAGPVNVWTPNGFEIPDLFYEPKRLDGTVGGALREHLLYFIRCMREGSKPDLVPIEDVRHGLAVVHALIRSAEEDREVPLSEFDEERR